MNTSDQPPAAPPAGSAPASARRFPWKLTLAGLLVVAAGAYLVLRPKTPAGPAGGPGARVAPVATVTAGTGDLPVYLTALGTVTSLNTATVRSQADGQLLKIHFVEGQPVKAGDLLAEIDPRAYQVALAQAEGQLKKDQALLENARLDLKRYEDAREAVTQQQIDTARSGVAEYEGTVLVDQASIDTYKLQLSYCRVTAPISGRAGLRLVDEGNLVRASDSTGLVVITQETPIAAVFALPEDALRELGPAVASGRELAVELYDRALKNRLATGRLAAVDNQIDTTTGTVKLKASFPNEQRTLFPNQFVNVRLLVRTVKDATLVPTSALQLSSQNAYVFVVGADSTLERRAVKTGLSEGEKIAVTEGLKPGETLVAEGLDKLQPGAKVAPRPLADRAARSAAADGAVQRPAGAGHKAKSP